jgi:ribonuclease T1
MSQDTNKPGRPSGAALLTILVALAVVAIYMANTGGMAYLLPDLSATPATTPPVQTVAPEQAQPPTPTIPAEIDGIPTIRYQDLPPEAHDTIALIAQGGPFPYEQDGSVFQNREGLLPSRPRGYYREHTVITPGESDRGARRIVTGGEGEFYYTDDHYASFQRVVQ